ncbi:MAG: YigZ family protein [Clostridia bacterium]|nr:YigZ family protein [Clostridia bacterium]MBR0445115.1 YigZ family protein [Clostridia bacterium]
MNGFRTIRREGNFELTVQKSRFIGQCFRAETEQDAASCIDAVRRRFYDAKHHCYAYCTGDGVMITRCSDDGEPSGTAGVPILNVLRQKNLTNTVCVVTRYFGGILLGTGGLARAYSETAAGALDDSGISEIRVCAECRCSLNYPQWAKLERMFRAECIDYIPQYTDAVTCSFRIDRTKYDQFRDRMRELTDGTLDIRLLSEGYYPADVTD